MSRRVCAYVTGRTFFWYYRRGRYDAATCWEAETRKKRITHSFLKGFLIRRCNVYIFKNQPIIRVEERKKNILKEEPSKHVSNIWFVHHWEHTLSLKTIRGTNENLWCCLLLILIIKEVKRMPLCLLGWRDVICTVSCSSHYCGALEWLLLQEFSSALDRNSFIPRPRCSCSYRTPNIIILNKFRH